MKQQNINLITTLAEKERTESVKAISLLGTLGSWIAVAITTIIYLLPELSEQNDPRYISLIIINLVLAICLSIANFFAHNNKLNLAIWFSIISTEIIFAITSFTVANLGIFLAITLLIILGNLILQSLTSKAAMIAGVSAIITSLIILSIDIFSLNPFSISPTAWLIEIIIIASGIMVLVLGMELLRYHQFKSIRSQVITTFIIISTIPIWTITITQLIRTNSSFHSNAYLSILNSANTQTRITILIAITLMLIALAVAIIASNLLTSPLNHLITILEDTNQDRLNFSTLRERKDEIGQLSKIIERTTLELKETLQTIETRVDERTAYLTITKKHLEERADQLRSIVEITQTITSIQNLKELLPEITQQISEKYGFYHVAIFLTDPTGQYAILKAATSEPGQRMMEKGHQIKVGQTTNSIIGIVASSGKPHITLEVNKEATPFSNSNLPNTCSEIVIPLQTEENIIGVLDLQSDKNILFKMDDDIDIYKLLAKQISLTIENARSLEETNTTLAEVQAFYKQSATTSWRDVLNQGTRGYRYLNGNVEAIKITKESSEKINNLNVGKKGIDPPNEYLIIPINIRGKSLGTLNIHQAERSYVWSNSEIRVYKSIVDRISFALENARLYQDAQKRAIKERVISEIATKVSSSVNMDNILQTAVEELGRVIPGSEIVIQLEHEDETGAEFETQE